MNQMYSSFHSQVAQSQETLVLKHASRCLCKCHPLCACYGISEVRERGMRNLPTTPVKLVCAAICLQNMTAANRLFKSRTFPYHSTATVNLFTYNTVHKVRNSTHHFSLTLLLRSCWINWFSRVKSLSLFFIASFSSLQHSMKITLI